MNVYTLTPDDKDVLFRLIAYGRGTPANIARAFDIMMDANGVEI